MLKSSAHFILLFIIASLAPLFCIAEDVSLPTPMDWKQITDILGNTGTLKDNVYTYRIPRSDLDVIIDGVTVPVGAGLESTFHFYKCPCGHFWVVGEFCCTEYESDDVVDALRANALIRIGSVAPLFSGDKPKLTAVRFQGDGSPETLARQLKTALTWIGEERTKAATRPAQ